MIPSNWTEYSLGEIADFQSGGTPSMQIPEFWNGNIPWLSAKDLKSFYLSNSILKITEKGAKSGTRVVPQNTILILVRGMTLLKDLPIGITTKSVAFNQDIRAIIPNKDAFPRFIAYALISQKKQLLSFVSVAGHGTGRLQSDYLKEFSIFLPPLAEQKKIAEILGVWDEGIEKTEKLIAAKQKRKKGLMQQLLTGKKRFKEFKGEKWKEYRIGSLLKEVKRPIKFDDNELYELISIRRRSGGLFRREKLYGHQIKVKDLREVRKGDFLISKMQVVRGALGLTTDEFDGKKISGSYIALIPRHPEILDIEYFNFRTHLPDMYRKVFLSCYGVHIEKMTFNMKLYFQEKLSIPSSLEEQHKIVSVLNAADQEIELLQKQLESLKQQKKGLMQKLLTGKFRVKV